MRIFWIIFGGTLGALAFYRFGPAGLEWLYRTIGVMGPDELAKQALTHIAVTTLGFLLGAGAANQAMRGFENAGTKWDKMDAGDKVTLFIGAVIGVIVSVPFMVLFTQQTVYIASIASIGLMIAVAAVAIYAMRSMGDLLPWQKGRKYRRRGIKILDTNVIIDGRIYDVARTGFLEGQLYVPQFVLDELQYIADSSDPLRRQRGRRGLDVLKLMQDKFSMEIGKHDYLATTPDEVDSKIVQLAKALGADIVTNDFNLNKVAKLQDIQVLNINDLALALKPNVLPQESLIVNVVREGSQHGQGIGYLDDGTMVVVDQGRSVLGETIAVQVTQVIQTERGKMIFAEIRDQGEPVPVEGPARRRREPRE